MRCACKRQENLLVGAKPEPPWDAGFIHAALLLSAVECCSPLCASSPQHYAAQVCAAPVSPRPAATGWSLMVSPSCRVLSQQASSARRQHYPTNLPVQRLRCSTTSFVPAYLKKQEGWNGNMIAFLRAAFWWQLGSPGQASRAGGADWPRC